jgi:Fur family ferric uptake transcriptional regulator
MLSHPISSSSSLADTARERLRHLGVRVTHPRVQVLACLLASEHPLTHQAVFDHMAEVSGPVDRVTVYRILDWLVEQHLAFKHAGEDRVFRFSLTEHVEAAAQAHRQHGHFECVCCHRTYCLDGPATPVADMVPDARVPAGFAVEHVELTLKGRCSQCR